MSEEEKSDIRLQCLHLASRALGENYDPEVVLIAAQDYYEWVVGKKPDLRIVSSNDDGVA